MQTKTNTKTDVQKSDISKPRIPRCYINRFVGIVSQESLHAFLFACLFMIAFVTVTEAFGQRGDGPRQAERQRSSDGSQHRGMRARRISLDQLDDAIEIVVHLQPDLESTLQEHREDNPERIRDMIEQRFPRVGWLLALKKRHPELYEMRLEEMKLTADIQKLVHRYQRARRAEDESVADETRKQIKGLVVQRFKLNQSLRKERLAAMEQYIEKMRAQLEEDAKKQAERVEQELKELLETPPDKE